MKKILIPLTGLLMAAALNAQTGMQFTDGLVHGIYRSYILYIPSSYSDSRAVPLLISMHGFTESASYQNSLANFRPIADTANFIIAMPEGQPNPQMYGFVGWNIFPISSGVDDLGFLEALIDTLSKRYSIDQNRIYLTGHSAGAIMSYEMACAKSNRIAAIAPVNGFMFPPHVSSCRPTHPVPVMEIHGTSDPVRSWDGVGPVTRAVHMDSLINHWVRVNGCSPVPRIDTLPNTITTDNSWVQHFTYSGGLAGSSVELYKVINGGHTWPGSSVNEPYGNTNKDFNACAVIWKFLSKYRLNRLNTVPGIASGGDRFLVYPNPVSTVLNIRATEPVPVRQIRVFNIMGQEILCLNDPVARETVSINTSHWARGLYMVTVTDGKNTSSFRVVK